MSTGTGKSCKTLPVPVQAPLIDTKLFLSPLFFLSVHPSELPEHEGFEPCADHAGSMTRPVHEASFGSTPPHPWPPVHSVRRRKVRLLFGIFFPQRDKV